jgi:hypothetical protein
MINLNEFGMAVWRHKTKKYLFAERSYSWCDRIVLIDESDLTHRRIVDDTKFSTFDFTDWVPMTTEEYAKVKSYYYEAYKGN